MSEVKVIKEKKKKKKKKRKKAGVRLRLVHQTITWPFVRSAPLFQLRYYNIQIKHTYSNKIVYCIKLFCNVSR